MLHVQLSNLVPNTHLIGTLPWSTMPQPWNPAEVLQIENDKRCVGFAPSKGRKCQNPINQGNFARCVAILAEMSRMEPNVHVLKLLLERLAEHALCVRYHRDQADAMVKKWSAKIREAAVATEEEQNELEEEEEDEVTYSYSSYTLSMTTAVRLSHLSTRNHVDDIPLHNPYTDQRERQQTPQRLSSAPNARRSTSNIPVPTPRLPTSSRFTTTTYNTTPDRVHIPTPPSSTRSASDRPPQTHITIPPNSPRPLQHEHTHRSSHNTNRASPPTTSTSTPPRHCQITHVRRLPIEAECPVCYDSISTSSDELVWCRSGCGQTVHAACFQTWRSTNPSQAATCMICRSPWAEACDCSEGCTATHAQKKSIAEDCACCLEDLRSVPNRRGEWTKPELVWCKSGCGKSVHKSCMEVWRETCVGRNVGMTCMRCRAAWVEGCEC